MLIFSPGVEELWWIYWKIITMMENTFFGADKKGLTTAYSEQHTIKV